MALYSYQASGTGKVGNERYSTRRMVWGAEAVKRQGGIVRLARDILMEAAEPILTVGANLHARTVLNIPVEVAQPCGRRRQKPAEPFETTVADLRTPENGY